MAVNESKEHEKININTQVQSIGLTNMRKFCTGKWHCITVISLITALLATGVCHLITVSNNTGSNNTDPT